MTIHLVKQLSKVPEVESELKLWIGLSIIHLFATLYNNLNNTIFFYSLIFKFQPTLGILAHLLLSEVL